MFAKRNSLTLGAIWLALLLGGIFWYAKDARTLMEVMQERKQYAAAVEKSQSQIERMTQIETLYKQLQEKWYHSPKRIVAAEEPAFTLSYLNDIVSSNDLDINYDFVLNDQNRSGDYKKFTYTLTGEGSYEDINELIWCLAYQPVVYKINNITLNRTQDNSDKLKFNMRLQGFTLVGDSETGMELTQPEMSLARIFEPQYNIFKPLLARTQLTEKRQRLEKPRLPAKLPGQIDVEKSKLKAVTPNSVFLSEGNGLVELAVGDAVYLGKLVKINQSANEAEFILTKFGKSTRVKLGIDERN